MLKSFEKINKTNLFCLDNDAILVKNVLQK